MKIANKFACIQRGSFLNFSAVAVIVMPVAMLFGSTDPARAQCTGHGSCEDVVLIPADGRNETGAFTGMDGACYAYEHRGFDGDRQTLGMRRIMNYVGSSFNDEIVISGCSRMQDRRLGIPRQGRGRNHVLQRRRICRRHLE